MSMIVQDPRLSSTSMLDTSMVENPIEALHQEGQVLQPDYLHEEQNKRVGNRDEGQSEI